MEDVVIIPSRNKDICYGSFFFVSAFKGKPAGVYGFDTYEEAVDEKKRTLKVKEKHKVDIDYLILGEVKFGANIPVLVGFDTNLNPFKNRYSEFKTVVRNVYKRKFL